MRSAFSVSLQDLTGSRVARLLELRLLAHELFVGEIAPEQKIMKTLYDLLGARPDDDPGALRAAFRIAAKANHPDLNAGDPYAAIRFRQVAEAYEILRDAEQRATYDRLLQFEHERFRWTLKSAVCDLMHSMVFDVVVAVGLAIILAGGYITYAHFSRTPAKVVAGTPARIAAGQPATPIRANKPRDRRDYAAGLAPEPTTGGPVPKASVLNSEVARVANAFAITAEQAHSKSVAERSDQSAGTETLDQDRAQSVKALSSARESNSVEKSSPSDSAASDDKRDMKRRDTRDINPSDVKVSDTKLPETKMLRRARMATKLQATSRTNFEQASLENRNTCSGSQPCSRDVPPLFGVGF
jgi:curved DNA-binding protein CbpA